MDYHLILDLLPTLAASYFKGKLPATLSYAQVWAGDFYLALVRLSVHYLLPMCVIDRLCCHHHRLQLLPELIDNQSTGLGLPLAQIQGAILLCLGLQRMDLTEVEGVLSLPSSQVRHYWYSAVKCDFCLVSQAHQATQGKK